MSVAVPSSARRARRRPRPLAALEVLAARLGLDLFELGALAMLAATSVATLAALLTRGRPLSGADGLLALDQLQYFAWIREASHHLLIGNPFDLEPGSRPFLHPGYALSGVLHRVTGVSAPLSFLLWKPVAVGITFAGCLLYVRRLLPPIWPRRVALVLGLFAVMPASAAVAWSNWGGGPREFTFDFISGEMWSGQYLWGYLMTSLAVFGMPLVLLAAERWRDGGRPALLALAALGALLVTWLQPWQGATLAGIVVAVEALWVVRGRGRARLALAAIPLAVALPSLYYLLLSHLDASWELASRSNAAGARPEWSWPWWAIALTVAPLAAPAALAYRLRAPTWQELVVRVWPFVALAVYLQPVGTFPYHAFQGLALPLSVLAVQGVLSVKPRPRPALVAAALVLLIVPGFAHKLEVAKRSVHAGGDPFFVFDDEVRALKALERDRRPGGVLAPTYAGYMTPYRTGRETYVGPFSWTPHWHARQRHADDLFEGRLTGAAARRFVTATNARFLFEDCRPGLADLRATLRPLLAGTRRFGCATVYELRFRPAMARAAGPPDA